MRAVGDRNPGGRERTRDMEHACLRGGQTLAGGAVMKCRLLLLGVALAIQACAPSGPKNTGVYLLVDTSGAYNSQVNKAEQIILYELTRLQTADSIAVPRIDRAIFTEKNIIPKATFDNRPS